MRKMGDDNTTGVESMETYHCLNHASTYLGNCPYIEHCPIIRRVYNTAKCFRVLLLLELANLAIPPAKKYSGRNWRFPKWTFKKPTSQELLPYYKRPKGGKGQLRHSGALLLPLSLAVISVPRFFPAFFAGKVARFFPPSVRECIEGGGGGGHLKKWRIVYIYRR